MKEEKSFNGFRSEEEYLQATKTTKINFDELPLVMTEAEFESTDFHKLTDNLLIKCLQAAGELTQLSIKYAITIVDEQGKTIRTEKITATIAPNIFLLSHPNVCKLEGIDCYQFVK